MFLVSATATCMLPWKAIVGARGDVRRFRIQIEFAECALAARAAKRVSMSSQCRKLAAASSRGVFLLLEALPQALGRAADLLGFIEHDQSALASRSSKVCSRAVFERRGKFPAGIGGSDARLLGQRQHLDLGELHDGALALDFEAANGFDLVAEEFDTQRARILGGEDVEDAAADGILAGHLHRLALLVADRNQVRFDGLERQFFADAQLDGEAAVVIAGVSAQQRGAHGRDGDGHFRGGHAPESDGALLADFGVRRKVLAREHIERRQQLWGARFGASDQKVEEGLGEFEQSLRALIAVGDHQQGALGELPQQHQIERLGGRRQPGEREFGIFVAKRLGEDLLKRRVAAEGLKEVADCRMGHKKNRDGA